MKRRSIVQWLSKLTYVAALLFTLAAPAADLNVMISAGFYKAYSELLPVFEKETGHKVITTRGPSLGDSPEAIPARLKRGEPADMVIISGTSVDDLISEGLVRADSKVNFARSGIGMVVREGAPKPDISNVEAFKRTLLEAKSIAYSDSASGIYLSTKLFPELGVADQVAGKSRKVRGPPSGEPVAAVIARGEAEIGFQQISELIHEPGVTYVGVIPPELQEVLFFSAGITKMAKQSAAAEQLIRFLASSKAAPVISESGLMPLTGQ